MCEAALPVETKLGWPGQKMLGLAKKKQFDPGRYRLAEKALTRLSVDFILNPAKIAINSQPRHSFPNHSLS